MGIVSGIKNAEFYRALQALRRRRRGWRKGRRRKLPAKKFPLQLSRWPEMIPLPNLAFPSIVSIVADITHDLTGEKIKSLRLAMRLSQVQFAKQVGVNVITLSRWENGHLKPGRLNRARIYEIASAFGKAVSEPGREHAPDFTR